jgi:hypothetical protein
MFAVISSVVVMAVAMAVVSSELYAALGAVGYAKRQAGSLVTRAKVAWARYEWASPLLHELAAHDAGVDPAYKASYAVAVFGGVLTALAVGHFAGALGGMSAMEALGAATLTAGGFFGSAYGRAFMAHRERVERAVQEGTWVLN